MALGTLRRDPSAPARIKPSTLADLRAPTVGRGTGTYEIRNPPRAADMAALEAVIHCCNFMTRTAWTKLALAGKLPRSLQTQGARVPAAPAGRYRCPSGDALASGSIMYAWGQQRCRRRSLQTKIVLPSKLDGCDAWRSLAATTR